MSSQADFVQQIMRLDCRNLVVTEADVLVNGNVRLTTKATKPDGSYIDLFIDGSELCNNSELLTVSDFGETLNELVDSYISVDHEGVRHVADIYDISYSNGSLAIQVTRAGILTGLLKLSQACLAIHCLEWKTSSSSKDRAYTPWLNVDSVRSVRPIFEATSPDRSHHDIAYNTMVNLEKAEVPFLRNARIHIDSSHSVSVDFLIKDGANNKAIMIVENSPYQGIIARRADRAFGVHSDLKEAEWPGSQYSIINSNFAPKEVLISSLSRLERVCTIIGPAQIPMIKQQLLQ